MEESNQYLDAIKRIESLHANMSVLSRLNGLLRNTNTDLDTVSRLIQSDGALATGIIKISNSAFFGSGQRNKDVHSALRKVGLNQALRLVGIAMSKQVFMHDLKAYGLTADDYWTYSYFCGVFMDTSAQRVGLNQDDAYLLGLLHALGRVVINELLRNTQVEIFWSPTIPPEQWEEIMVGFRYYTAGAMLLECWKFEPLLCKDVREQCDETCISANPLLALLDYTRQLALMNRWNMNLENWVYPQNHAYLHLTGSEEDQIAFDLRRSCQLVKDIRETLKNY